MTIGLYKHYHLGHTIFLSASMVTDTGLVLYILKCFFFSLYEKDLFSKEFSSIDFFIFIFLTKWHLHLNILKIGDGLFFVLK